MKNEMITLEVSGAQLTASKKELFMAWFERHFNPEPLEFYSKLSGGLPKLNEGEIYVGAVTDPSGVTSHTILLPGDHDDTTWKASMEWAKSIGGDLPNLVEQAMLFRHFKSEFQDRSYWSNERREAGSAWSQLFGSGGQSWGSTFNKIRDTQGRARARAVRRVAL